MRKIQTIIAITVLVLTGFVAANAQNTVNRQIENPANMARLQVIHNAADPAAEVVDVYVNEDLFIDDFEFRAATAFVDVPAGVELAIGVAPGNSGSVDDTIASFPVTFMSNETYVAVANGVLNPGMYAPNPDGMDIAFTLFARDGIREGSGNPDMVSVIALHGSTDAPTVDVVPLYDDLTYGEFSGYADLPEGVYTLEIKPGDDSTVTVAAFTADLNGLGGGAAVVFASGFLAPENNMNGPAFGLYAALPNGDVVAFPVVEDETARLQVIHNAADPAAEVVDVYVNDDLFIDDFEFRAASGFVDVPADVELVIGVAPGNSGSVDDTIASFPVTFEANETYVAIANGVLDPNMFAENPDGMEIGFNLYAMNGIMEGSGNPDMVSVIAFHGSTDAPTVDVVAKEGYPFGPLFDGLTYGEYSDYVMLPENDYILYLTPDEKPFQILVSYEVNLSGLGGGAAVVFASGFFDPEANQNGPAFGLFAALPNGTVVEFPAVAETARLQLIHNVADPAAFQVDLYLDDTLVVDNFTFRTATQYVSATSDVSHYLGVAPANSGSVDDTIASFEFEFEADETYLLMFSGVLDTTMFSPNPEGIGIGFDIFTRDEIIENPENPNVVPTIAYHGATDAPEVDIEIRDVGVLYDDLSYRDFSDYAMIGFGDYILDVTAGGNTVASFHANVTEDFAGETAVVFASGFLNPENNQNGPAFGLFASFPDGEVVALPQVGMEEATANLQIIHNSADAEAEVVDIYVNGDLFLKDFAFRTATPFVSVPAGVDLKIGVAPSENSDSGEIVAEFVINLNPNENYVAIANGVVTKNGYSDNPDGKDIGFTLFTRDKMNIAPGSDDNMVNVIAVHGSSDAPSVDFTNAVNESADPVIDNLTYGEFSDYLKLQPTTYLLDMTLADNNNAIVATYKIDLNGLGSSSAVLFASGFLNPKDNNDGPAFGLYAALSNGTVVQFLTTDELITRLSGDGAGIPVKFSLNQNYPNPFNPATNIEFALPTGSDVSLRVYNVMGQEIETLVDGYMDAGVHQVSFDASDHSSGLYFYRLNAGSFSDTRKMMLVK
ncbi:MAG: DUF4397 domain-containing protein [candidate division Zixibacteria bacterium]|nr:DUF4397 domain-containing protein [candidate division Zixibacteria bacterium]